MTHLLNKYSFDESMLKSHLDFQYPIFHKQSLLYLQSNEGMKDRYKNMRCLSVIFLNNVGDGYECVLKLGTYKDLIYRPGCKVVIIGISPPNVVLPELRKFLIQSNEKAGKQIRNSMSQETNEQDRYFYNIMNPSNKIQCDECKRDISKATKLLTTDTDYCPSCFANLQQFPAQYHVLNKLDFPLFDHEWTADEELFLFEGLQKHGFGNWTEIADFIGTNKTREDVEEHYHHTYLGNKDFIPAIPILTKRDNQGRLIINSKESPGRRPGKPSTRPTTVVNSQPNRERAALTVHQTAKSGSSPAEIVGYMPKRGDFQVEYDNDAELLLAEMEFNDEDTEEQKAMKFRLIDIYNQKLNQRIRRKQFVISRGLLDLKQQIRLDRTRTKEEKQIYNMLKVFARFNNVENHEKLVQAVLKEKQLRQRIEELKEFKKKGFRNLAQIQAELEGKKKKDDKIKRKEAQFISNDKSKTRRMRKDPINQKGQSRVLLISRQQQDLCKKLSLTFSQYVIIKEGILRESVRLGRLSKDYVFRMFKLEQTIIQKIFDYLVQEQEIIMEENVA